MRIAKIENNSLTNGPGIRVVVWCQGCSLHCKGCHNESTWDEKGGQIFNDSLKYIILDMLNKPWIKGLTLSGGHPLEPYNIEDCEKLARLIKHELPNKDIWLYTGLLWEDIKDLSIMQYVDVIVDGPFIQEQRNISLPYCGSNNQRVIDVKLSKEQDKIVLFENR